VRGPERSNKHAQSASEKRREDSSAESGLDVNSKNHESAITRSQRCYPVFHIPLPSARERIQRLLCVRLSQEESVESGLLISLVVERE
jgi:DNA-binding TFAR19-related protein (PDSD5 family)